MLTIYAFWMIMNDNNNHLWNRFISEEKKWVEIITLFPNHQWYVVHRVKKYEINQQHTTKQLTLLIDPVHFSRRSVHRSIIVKKLFHWFFAITLSKHIRQSHIICYFFIILKLTKSCLLWVAYRIVDEWMMMMNFRIFFHLKFPTLFCIERIKLMVVVFVRLSLHIILVATKNNKFRNLSCVQHETRQIVVVNTKKNFNFK